MRRPSLVSALVLVLGLLAVACSSEPDPPPVPASGVVTIPSLLSRPDLVDVDIGTEGAADGYWQGELVVIGLDRPADQRFVVRAQPPAPIDLSVEDSANHHSLEVDGHPAVLEVYDVGPGCGRNVLTVAVATDARLVVAGVTPRSTADLVALARELAVTDGRIATDGVDPARGRIGRLDASWLLGGGGTRMTVGYQHYLVRRADPAEQSLLLAVRCPDPQQQLSPPPSTNAEHLDRYAPARHRVAGRTVDTGVLGQVEIAVVRGEHGALVASPLGCCRLPGPGSLVRYAGEVASRPAATVRAIDERTRRTTAEERGRSLDDDIAGERATPVARGSDGDLAWVLARRSQRYLQGAVEPEVCWSVVTTLDGTPGSSYMTECLLERTSTGTLVPAPTGAFPQVDHVWGAVGPKVAVVEVQRPGRRAVRVRPLATATGPLKHLFVVVLDPPALTVGFVQGDLLRRSLVLQAGPIVLRALDAQGTQLTAVAIGKAGCPVPPGCPA